jgi:hypothetical protein
MSIINRVVSALIGASMLAVSLSPASALTLSSTSINQSVASPQIEKVWYCRWNCGGYRPGWGYRAGYGWQAGWRGPGWQGPGWGGVPLGAVAAGALVGAAVAPVYAAPYGGPCWRRAIGPYGGVRWVRVC